MNHAGDHPQLGAFGGFGERLERALVGFLYARRGIEAVNDRLLRSYRAEALLALYGARIGTDVIVHGPLVIHNAERDYASLAIHDRSHVGRLSILDLTGQVVIEREATISMGATILTHTDVGESPLRERLPRVVAGVRIGKGSYIGANATILPGCDIGNCAIVGAGALVNRSVLDGMTVAGVPARPVGAASR
jgi:acetyltransferase-like isoleucine patch superfamily enzyme